MNKEEILNTFLLANIPEIITQEEFDDVKKTIRELQQENKQLKDNWDKLKEWASNFYNSEEVGWAGCGMRYTLEKILELENETANNCNDCKQCKGSDNNG